MENIDLEKFRQPIRFIIPDHRIKYVAPDGKEFFDKWEYEKHMIRYNLDREFEFILARIKSEKKDRIASYVIVGSVLVGMFLLCLFI